MGRGEGLSATDRTSSRISSLRTSPQTASFALSSKMGEEEQMRKTDAWQRVELRSDGFRQWTVTGKGIFYRFSYYLLKKIIFDPILTFLKLQ